MEDQVLTIEQMRELIDMGIDVSKASMVWYPKMAIDARTGKGYAESHYLTINHINNEHFCNTREGKETIPALTIQDILEMLPDKIVKNQVSYILEIDVYDKCLTYGSIPACDTLKYYQYSNNILEAAFKMLKWYKEYEESNI